MSKETPSALKPEELRGDKGEQVKIHSLADKLMFYFITNVFVSVFSMHSGSECAGQESHQESGNASSPNLLESLSLPLNFHHREFH